MAEDKLITMKEYNGTDYDDLYPETTSAQALLDQQAQTITNLESGKTVNDALEDITQNGGSFQVGDVIVTSRTDLGDKWLLCNGASVNVDDYPILAQLFNTQELTFHNQETLSIGGTSAPILTTDGATMVLSTGAEDTGDISGGSMIITTADGVSWGSQRYSQFNVFGVKYIKDNFVAYQQTLNTTSSAVYAYKSTITELLETNPNQIEEASGNYSIYKLGDVLEAYNKVYFYTIFNTGRNDVTIAGVSFADNLNGPYYNVEIRDLKKIFYENNILFCSSPQHTQNDASPLRIVNANNTITNIDIPGILKIGSWTYCSTPYIAYLNGYWYGGWNKTIYRTNNISSNVTWELVYTSTRTPSPSDASQDDIGIHIWEAGGYIFTDEGHYITANGEVKELTEYIAFDSAPILFNNRIYGAIRNTSTNAITVAYTALESTFNVPSFSPANNLYAYIRAKR